MLLAADGGVVSAEVLLEKVWDEHADPFTNTVSVHHDLLRKLGDPPLIETVIGSGYRLLACSARPGAARAAGRHDPAAARLWSTAGCSCWPRPCCWLSNT